MVGGVLNAGTPGRIPMMTCGQSLKGKAMIRKWFLLWAAVALVAGAGKPNRAEVRVMATRTWTGVAADGDFSNTANWSAAFVPVTGDSIVVSASASYGMTTNLDRSADAPTANGLNIVDFKIEKGFAYNIGSLTLPLRLTADKFTDLGNGEVYFCTDTGAANLDTDRVIIDKDDISKLVYLIFPGDFGASDSTFTLIEVVRGANVNIGSGVSGDGAGTLWISPRFSDTDVFVTINYSASVTNTYMNGGELKLTSSGGALTTLNLGGGSVDFRLGTIATLNQAGGVIQHNCPTASGSITTYNAFGGFLDSRQTAGTKVISLMNRVPQFTYPRNPDLVVSTENFIGG